MPKNADRILPPIRRTGEGDIQEIQTFASSVKMRSIRTLALYIDRDSTPGDSTKLGKQLVAAVDRERGVVEVFDVTTGVHVVTMQGTESSGRGQMLVPSGCAFNREGELFVADSVLDKILVFDQKGAFVRCFGELGNQKGQFDSPQGLAFLDVEWDEYETRPAQHLVVADKYNNRVQLLRQDGTSVQVKRL